MGLWGKGASAPRDRRERIEPSFDPAQAHPRDESGPGPRLDPPQAQAKPRDESGPELAPQEQGDNSFADYAAFMFAKLGGFSPGVPPEAAAIAEASDSVLSGLGAGGFEIIAIIDRDRHPDKRFLLTRKALEEIARACDKYRPYQPQEAFKAGMGLVTIRPRPRKRQISIKVIETGAAAASPEQTLRLSRLKRMPGFEGISLSGWVIGHASKSLWTSAPFDGRFLGANFMRWLMDPKAMKSPAPAALPVPSFPLLTWAILAVLAAVFACEWIFAVAPANGARVSPRTLTALGGLQRGLVAAGQWHRLLSAAFLHVDPRHLVANGICLYFAGKKLEPLIGRGWFGAIFILGALGGALGSLATIAPNIVSVGASGAISAILAAMFVVGLRFRFGPTALLGEMTGGALVLLIPALIPLGLSAASGQNLDYGAHFGGALTGLALGYLLLRLWPRTQPSQRWRSATARAISVLPVPGEPTSRQPRGMRPPSRWNFCGSLRNSTISCRSCFASSTPATSSKVTRPCASLRSFAFDLPKPMARPAPFCI